MVFTDIRYQKITPLYNKVLYWYSYVIYIYKFSLESTLVSILSSFPILVHTNINRHTYTYYNRQTDTQTSYQYIHTLVPLRYLKVQGWTIKLNCLENQLQICFLVLNYLV